MTYELSVVWKFSLCDELVIGWVGSFVTCFYAQWFYISSFSNVNFGPKLLVGYESLLKRDGVVICWTYNLLWSGFIRQILHELNKKLLTLMLIVPLSSLCIIYIHKRVSLQSSLSWSQKQCSICCSWSILSKRKELILLKLR